MDEECDVKLKENIKRLVDYLFTKGRGRMKWHLSDTLVTFALGSLKSSVNKDLGGTSDFERIRKERNLGLSRYRNVLWDITESLIKSTYPINCTNMDRIL